jgi:hypothetical protein
MHRSPCRLIPGDEDDDLDGIHADDYNPTGGVQADGHV